MKSSLPLMFVLLWTGILPMFAAPTVTTTTPTPTSGVTSLTSVAITFSETVTGVDAGDLLINGAATTAVSGSGAGPYSFTFTQPANGTVNVSWLAAHGITGTSGAFVAGASWQYYLGAPQISSISPSQGATVGALTSISITFNQPISGINSSDLEVNGAVPATVSGTGAGPYVFSFTQPPPGTVSVGFDFDHGITGIGTGPFVGGNWSYQLSDSIAPTVGNLSTSVAGQEMLAVTPSPNSTIVALSQATVTFSEYVTGVDAADLLINGSPATSVEGTGAGPYIFTINSPADGPVNFTWAGAHGIKDEANNSFAGNSWSVTKTASIGTVVITEFLAANAGASSSTTNGNRDENFDLSPWIELTNTSAVSVNLTGWSLTDDVDKPDQWILPARTLAAGARLVLWASGKDRKPASGHLHTNFSLSSAGGNLALYNADSPRGPATSAFLNYPPQRYDYSYGPQSSDGALRYFTPPSITQTAYTLPTSAAPNPTAPAVPLGSANGTSVLTALIPNPTASVGRGFFNEAFSTILSCSEPTATIRYTLDGSVPTGSSAAYSSPLAIASTTVLRMAAFAPNRVPSEVVTHSYLFLNNVINQPSPPYNDPTNANDNANPAPPSVGGVPLPVNWGYFAGVAFPGSLMTNISATNSATSNEVPADYGMDPKVYADPTKYDDTGAVNPTTGRTNLERINQALRDLPILSCVLKSEDMWGNGSVATTGRLGLYPNSSDVDKTDRTKACSLELLLPDGSTGFSVDCGIDLHGNASRNPGKCAKHGFTLKFKGRYGAGKLKANLFPDAPVGEWDKLVLRADFNSSWLHQAGINGIAVTNDSYQRARGIRVRDAWSKHTFRDMGRIAGHHRYTNLFINGIYWGTYDLAEDQADDFAASYFGGNKQDYDVVEQGVLKSGSWTAYYAMKSIIGWTGATFATAPTAAEFAIPFTNAKYEQIKQYLDVPWFIDYMILHHYVGHRDWATAYDKNWYAIRPKNGTFKYLPWDQENLLWHESEDRVTGMTNFASGSSPSLLPPTAIHPRMKSNSQYLLDFADRVHKHCVAPNGALLPPSNISRLNTWASIMNANAMCLESARWGDYRYKVHAWQTGSFSEVYTWNGKWYESSTLRTNTAGTNNWASEITRLTGTYFPARTTNLLAQYRTNNLYPLLNAPEFRDNSNNTLVGSQNVAAGYQLKLSFPASPPSGTTNTGAIYFTTDGTDPRVYYTGTIQTGLVAYSSPITLNTTTTVKARALNGSTWSALMEATFTVGSPLPRVVISEINYNPKSAQGGSAGEFIEIWNAGSSDVDLSGWSMAGIDFIFPVGLTLSAGNRLVLANNESPSVFATQFPGVNVTGYYGGNLANSGERLSLLDQLGRIVFSVEYDNAAPWPTTPDNGGYSLELINPAGDPQSSCNWQASAVLKGTPGAANAAAPASTIVINEFAAPDPDTFANGGTETGFVELANVTNAPIDVSGWNITASGSSVSLPASTVIAANGLLQIPWIYGTSLAAKVPAPSISTHGELTLTNAAAVRIDGVRYGPQAFGYSFGRNGNNWQLCIPTPGTVNSIATVAAQSSLKINEWLANPSSGEEDWLELKNLDGTKPIVITDLIVEKNGEPYRIAAPSAVAASSWVRLYCNTGAKRADAILLQLPATGAALTLKTSVNSVIHTLNYAAQTTNVSQGLLPDGTGSATTLGYPSPGAANHLALTNVPLLNEVLVLNRNGDNAPWAHRPGWVELKNPTASAINLSGWKLRVPNGASWKFPTGSSLAANGFLSVWADAGAPSSTTTSLHLNCALPLTQPGVVELVNSVGQIADRIAWGTQLVDQSIGRLPDNSWALLTTPTRGVSNAAANSLAAVTSVKINEWLPLASSEFFEIYNPNASPVNLAGLWLGDEPSELGRKKWQVPALSFVGAQSFGVFGPTSSNAALEIPPQSIPFRLSANGEYIRLSQNDSNLTAIDAVNFGLIASGSAGRIPDGSATIQALNPSPGATNNTTPGPAILEHPMSAIVDLGGAATFSVRVLNPSIATYQWKRNGTTIAGEESETLTISVTTLTDEADYTCTVTDLTGTITSRTAHLTVLYTYATWAAAHGVAAGTSDDDGDGLNNYAEFLANSDPLTPATTEERDEAFHFNRLEMGPSINFLSADFLLNRRAAFNRLIGYLSPDLFLWSDAEPASTTLLNTESNGDQHLRLKFSVPTNTTRMFLRMKLLP